MQVLFLPPGEVKVVKVAWVERSETRVSRPAPYIPGFAALNPGYI